jgi:catechol 2,3-dioxygenase-like lactoylglutathione lyase family enzyme
MSTAKVAGLNHVTLGVRDLHRSISFYRDVLGFAVRAIWDDGAYLEAGVLWLCLSVESDGAPSTGYTHIAFDVSTADFDPLSQRIREAAQTWKENSSEGGSVYFLDPDGHKLELHVGSIETRLAHYRATSNARITIF